MRRSTVLSLRSSQLGIPDPEAVVKPFLDLPIKFSISSTSNLPTNYNVFSGFVKSWFTVS